MPAHIYARLFINICISMCVRMRMYEMGTHCYFLTRCTFLAYDDDGAGGKRVCLSVFVLCLLANWKIDMKRNAKSQQQQQRQRSAVIEPIFLYYYSFLSFSYFLSISRSFCLRYIMQ